ILKRYPGRRHITLGFSPFVPKAHTPFQWEQQDSFDTTKQKLAWIKRSLRGKGVEIRHHDTADTAIEGIISRGGREIADVIEGAWRKGARFDGWGEHCKFEYWQEALADNGLTLDQTFRERDEDEELPWEIVSYKIPRSYFLKERHKAYAAAETEECKHERCSACGVCDFDAMHNILAPPADTPKPEAARGLLQGVPGTTVRLGYRKGEGVRFISHLDLMRELERTFRRAGLPMLYSEGFSPRPKMSAGAPLALGWTSDAEWLDIGLAGEWQEFELHELLDKLNASVAAGIEFTIAAALPPRQESLNAAVTRSTYIVRLPAPIFDTNLGDLEKAFTSLLDRESVIVDRVRRKKVQQLDVRPMIADASVVSDREIVITTVSYEGRMVKPTEIVAVALGIAEDRLPLLQVHKIGATTAAGDSPVERAVALAEVEQFETGNINYGHAAGNAGSYSGG
ncbi:MAG: TIGR03936 family radical SAM-associated protein, partial [Gemmatimonadales bacterium]